MAKIQVTPFEPHSATGLITIDLNDKTIQLNDQNFANVSTTSQCLENMRFQD